MLPMDHNVERNEKEKIRNYEELQFEIEQLWKTKTKVILIVIGSLGTVSNKFEDYLEALNVGEIKTHQIQKCVVLRTGNILRKHLRI